MRRTNEVFRHEIRALAHSSIPASWHRGTIGSTNYHTPPSGLCTPWFNTRRAPIVVLYNYFYEVCGRRSFTTHASTPTLLRRCCAYLTNFACDTIPDGDTNFLDVPEEWERLQISHQNNDPARPSYVQLIQSRLNAVVLASDACCIAVGIDMIKSSSTGITNDCGSYRYNGKISN